MRDLFLPVSTDDVKARGWDQLDIILITGDAYVDHPSYGAAVIGRVLESKGYRVGIIAQPDIKNVEDFRRMGRPRLFFGITSGNVDSMIANYTANKKIRSTDDYSPGGKAGLRPDRAVMVYANMVRQAYKDIVVVLGGVEASLRRLSHYDYWSDTVRRSILLDSKADILVYGMGERQIIEVAKRLDDGIDLNGIRGTVVVRNSLDGLKDIVQIPSFEKVSKDKEEFRKAFAAIYKEMSPARAKVLVQPHADRFVIQFPPPAPLTTSEMDAVYDLPYVRAWHPVYDKAGGVPGYETVRSSLISHRGCCGECSFCALYLHQGRIIQSRSRESILKEAHLVAGDKKFGGTITDVGGPTVNMYKAGCDNWQKSDFCAGKKCLTPHKCQNLRLNYKESLELYRQLRNIHGVKHVFLGSGLRYDLLVDPQAQEYLEEICKYHISGLLKVAPEHCCNEVLRLMGKPDFQVYEKFVELFKSTVKKVGKKSYIVNYFIASHPGCGLREALNLALYLVKRGVKPEQIQDFIPTPMTVAGCMYWTEKDPFTGKGVYVAKGERERRLQRALMQYAKIENKPLVIEALRKLGAMHVAGRLDGNDKSQNRSR